MNKSQLIATIAENAGLTAGKAEEALRATIDAIVQTLTEGGTVSLVGFGNFGVKKRNARKVRNPKTGEEMMLKETIIPFFKAGKNLKETVDSDSKKD